MMLDAGVSSRRGIMCTHREEAYQIETCSSGIDGDAYNCKPGSCKRLTESELAQEKAIILPIFHQITEQE